MTPWRLAIGVLLLPTPALAGLYDSGEKFAALPSAMRGFLLDHRALRTLAARADAPSSLFRDGYIRRLEQLEKRDLNADESADLGAILIRLGRTDRAAEVLSAAHRKHPDHFRVVSNFATASQLRGDLERAESLLTDAVRLAPEDLREFERMHLRLVRLRAREKADADSPDDLFGVPLDAKDKLPKNALAIAQQLALTFPADARLLWQVGELANTLGDPRTAAAILDGCVTELGLASPAARERRRKLREAVDALDALPEDQRHVAQPLASRSPRPLVNRLDVSLLPMIRADGVNAMPWLVLGETTIGRGFKPLFLPHLDKLEGKRVSLTGFMQPLGDGPDLSAFLLLENPVGCWYCESPDLASVVQVEMPADTTTAHLRKLVKVEGTLELNRRDPERYLFTLKDAKVTEPD